MRAQITWFLFSSRYFGKISKFQSPTLQGGRHSLEQGQTTVLAPLLATVSSVYNDVERIIILMNCKKLRKF